MEQAELFKSQIVRELKNHESPLRLLLSQPNAVQKHGEKTIFAETSLKMKACVEIVGFQSGKGTYEVTFSDHDWVNDNQDYTLNFGETRFRTLYREYFRYQNDVITFGLEAIDVKCNHYQFTSESDDINFSITYDVLKQQFNEPQMVSFVMNTRIQFRAQKDTIYIDALASETDINAIEATLFAFGTDVEKCGRIVRIIRNKAFDKEMSPQIGIIKALSQL